MQLGSIPGGTTVKIRELQQCDSLFLVPFYTLFQGCSMTQS